MVATFKRGPRSNDDDSDDSADDSDDDVPLTLEVGTLHFQDCLMHESECLLAQKPEDLTKIPYSV